MIESWKEELDRKYEEATSKGDTELIDKANKIILDAIAELDSSMNKKQKWVEIYKKYDGRYDDLVSAYVDLWWEK